MWTEMPLYDEQAATFSEAWWAFRGAIRCWWFGHRGSEHRPAFEGDKHWRVCTHCSYRWEWKDA